MHLSDTGTPPTGIEIVGGAAKLGLGTRAEDTAPRFSLQHPGIDHDDLEPLDQAQIDWFLGQGVIATSLACPEPVMTARGIVDEDGFFDFDPSGERWLAFQEPGDMVFWCPRSGRIATWLGRAFAQGEGLLDDRGYWAFALKLRVFADPLRWLRFQRHGIVIIRWRDTFDRLRDVPAIEVDPAIRPQFDRYFKPQRLPRVTALKGGQHG